MSTEKRNQPWDEPVEVRNKGRGNYQKYLKYSVTSLLGFSLGLLIRVTPLALVPFCLFLVYVLLE